jgi:cytochrome c-type biogenesis protein CcmE
MRKSTRSLLLAGIVIGAALGFLLYQGLSNNLVYYITPSELMAKGTQAEGQNFRLGGQVRPDSVYVNRAKHLVRFMLQDPKSAVQVVTTSIPPPMFRAGVGVVVEGTYAHGLFTASDLMVKHCATYRAPKPGQVPKPDNCVTA